MVAEVEPDRTEAPLPKLELRALTGASPTKIDIQDAGFFYGKFRGLPDQPLRAEFGLMGDLAIEQVHDILDALIEQDEPGRGKSRPGMKRSTASITGSSTRSSRRSPREPTATAPSEP